MVQAIIDITVNQGIDPRQAVLIGGGGAAGLTSVRTWRHRLQSPKLVIPELRPVLSAAGAMMSDLRAHYYAHCFTTSRVDYDAVNSVLAALAERAGSLPHEFGREAGTVTPVVQDGSALRRAGLGHRSARRGGTRRDGGRPCRLSGDISPFTKRSSPSDNHELANRIRGLDRRRLRSHPAAERATPR